MGPREMFSLGDVTKPASMGPVGRPWTTGQLEIETDEPDCVRSSPTGSESDSNTETLPPVIKAEGEVFTGRVNTSVVMGQTEPSEVMCGPGVQVYTAEGSSDSPSVNPDPVIRTGADGRTDDMKFETIKGQSGSSVVSPSSDSGVHSVDEQWECMSTYSGDSDSIQSVKTVYGGVACQTDSPGVKLRNMDTRGVIHPLRGPHGDHDSMSSLSTNGHNSDIADMGDFSDGEEEQWEEVEPSEDVQTDVRTDCVGNDASNSCERSELPKKATVVTPHDMEFHDEDYWTNFRLLAKQAFKLDNVKLAASDRSGITFTADLCVPWDAPESVVDMNSPDLISLGPFPDKVGLFGRRREAAMSRIMKGRDCRSVRFVVPDVRLVDRGFHDVTVVDMEDDREPTVVLQDMTRLRKLWPVEVFDHMRCHQQDLELMRKSAKKDYVQTRPMPCRFCGKVIRVDMYRHVARLHLDLVQLWRCPIAWCTTWKGSPQDCLEHVRSGHDAPWVEKTASIEKYAPPWTVSRQLWLDSLRIEHSGISTDMLLFSEVGMPLTQHYRVYKGGLPHAVFRTDYLPRLRALLPSPGGSDDPSGNGYGSTPTSVRRLRRMSRPTRLFPGSALDVPILTEENPAEMVGEPVFDCRPPLLPVSIPLSDLSLATISGACDCASNQQLEESGRSIMNMDTNEISINRIVGFAWNDSGTDVEDELPSPVSSPVRIMSPSLAPAGSDDPFGRGANFDLDLANVFCDAAVLPSLVTPLVDAEAAAVGTAANYDPPVEPVGISSLVRDSVADESLDGSFLQLLREPRELLTVTPPVSPMVADTSTPIVAPDSVTETITIPSTSPVLPAGGVPADPCPDFPGRDPSTHPT